MIWIIYYLLIVNVITLSLYGYDKWQARKKGPRISEKKLHIYALIGGSLGAIVGQKVFRHKTIKRSFQIIYWTIVISQIAVCYIILR